MTHPIQHIGNTILLVMMDVEQGHEAEFDRWYVVTTAFPDKNGRVAEPSQALNDPKRPLVTR